MIAVLLTILKILGLILLGILTLVIALLLIVMLVPIRYRAEGHGASAAEDIRVEGRLTWLLHLVSVRFLFEDKALDTKVRIAWKHLGDDEKAPEPDEHAQPDATPSEQPVTQPRPVEYVPEAATEPVVHSEPVSEEKTGSAQAISSDIPASEPRRSERPAPEPAAKTKAIKNRRKRQIDYDRIIESIRRIGDRKEDILSFLESGVHRKALAHVWRRVKKLGKKLIPRLYELHGSFGMDDPCTTGRITAVLAVLYPYTERHIDMIPDFEKKALDLDGQVKGKVRLGSFVVMVLPLLIDRRFWRTIKDAKQLKARIDATSEYIKEGEKAA